MPTRRVATATSPFSPRGEDGLPIDLPAVDDAFDFDGYVAEQLSRAEALAENRSYREVREVLAALLERDPINLPAQDLLERVSLSEVASQRLQQAIELEARGRLVRALEVYREVPRDTKEHEEAKSRLSTLEPRVLESELSHAAEELKSKKTWTKAHKRLVRILSLIPNATEAKSRVDELEAKMKEKEIALIGRTLTVEKKVRGSDLVGKRYRPPFDTYAQYADDPRYFRIVPGDRATNGPAQWFVTLDAGTGIVHVAPAFGEDDWKVWKNQSRSGEIEMFCAVRPDGGFSNVMGDLEGTWVKDADKTLTKRLGESGILVHAET